jgi:hypothetical protein
LPGREENVNLLKLKWLAGFSADEGKKKGDEKLRVSLAMLLKIHIENMSLWGLLAMLMKTQDVQVFSRDVDENIRGYSKSAAMTLAPKTVKSQTNPFTPRCRSRYV